MKYRRVGRSGLKISEISFGGWLTFGRTLDKSTSDAIVRKALELGINFFDFADVYAKGQAELAFGEAIKGLKRSDMVISSKVFWPMSENPNDTGLSRKHIMESVEGSLRRMGTDYLDIYFCHRHDPDTEVDEVVRAMDDLVHQGKILYWGTSVWEAEQIERAVNEAIYYRAYSPIVEQPRYNMLDRHIEEEIMPICERHGIGLVVWSPLAEGLLTGKYSNGIPTGSRGASSPDFHQRLTPENLSKIAELAKLAAAHNLTLSQMALAWVLRLPIISAAITGATSVQQLEENVAASEVTLSNELLEAIDSIVTR
jgi:voltage-dependent potassium channel beta subunit